MGYIINGRSKRSPIHICDNHISGTTSVDFLAISSIIQSYDTDFQMITLKLTAEEASVFTAALDRALDNPFIQDDDECYNALNALSGHLEGAIVTSSN